MRYSENVGRVDAGSFWKWDPYSERTKMRGDLPRIVWPGHVDECPFDRAFFMAMNATPGGDLLDCLSYSVSRLPATHGCRS